MPPKQYLQQAFVLDRLIKSRQTRIEELRELQMWINSPSTSERVQCSPRTDRIAELTVRLLDAMAECVWEITQLVKTQREIIAAINSLPRPEYRLVLYERYINMKKWDEIAEDNNYAISTVFKLHGLALQAIKKSVVKCSMICDIM